MADDVPKEVEYLAWFGVTAELLLGEDQLVVDFNVENALRTSDEGKALDDMLVVS